MTTKITITNEDTSHKVVKVSEVIQQTELSRVIVEVSALKNGESFTTHIYENRKLLIEEVEEV